jgi:choline dehydrogenase-like flavoprotein
MAIAQAPSIPCAATSIDVPVQSLVPRHENAPTCLSHRERAIVAAIAEAAIPQGKLFEAGGEGTARRLLGMLENLPPTYLKGYRALLWTAELSTLPSHRQTFSALPLEPRTDHFARWKHSSLRPLSHLARAVLLPMRFAHYDSPNFYEKVNVPFQFDPPSASEVARWHQQVSDGAEIGEDLELECEVVVVGTGAGGAPCAYELASRGRAVLLLEEGPYFDRRHFDGRPFEAFKKMYRGAGLTLALGNVGMPVWAGRAVGGSTAVNSGTCYRAPERTFARWRRAYGLHEFSSSSLDPYYTRVETMLGVETPENRFLGGVARVVARGADRLGFSHGPVQRNAPGCDGAGVCVFGCPRGAKRSTDVSYVPAALERGAQLVTQAHVHTILQAHGRATGVLARLPSGRTLRVKADAVVVSGGALMTPLLLRANGIGSRNRWLGRNLSIHPASKVMAVFDENIDMVTGAIPQSYAVDEFADEGLMLEGASVPPSTAAVGIWSIGKDFVDLMESYRRMALFGFMIQDHSRGRVLPGRHGSPLIVYDMSREDALRMQRGIEIACEIFLAAGAKRVYPFVTGQHAIDSPKDLDTLRARRLRPGDFEVTSYHPLGTCRIGTDPARSVLTPDHQTRDVRHLYVVDGSAIPSSLGVNPQMTIMAMALRAAEIIHGRLG